ncbi:hypothetical protein [Pseudarthrobacter siccitolerans]
MTLTFVGQPYSELARDGELEFRMLAGDPAYHGGGIGQAWCPKSSSMPGS